MDKRADTYAGLLQPCSTGSGIKMRESLELSKLRKKQSLLSDKSDETLYQPMKSHPNLSR